MRLADVKRMNYVKRWSIVNMPVHRQSIAEHSYHVAMIALAFAKEFKIPEQHWGSLLAHALCHDLEETFTGDVTHYAKRGCFDDKKANGWVCGWMRVLFGDLFGFWSKKRQLRIVLFTVKTADYVDWIIEAYENNLNGSYVNDGYRLLEESIRNLAPAMEWGEEEIRTAIDWCVDKIENFRSGPTWINE